VPLLSHSPSSLRGPGGQERCPRTGERPMSLQSSKRQGGPRELQAGQPHLHPGKGDGAAYPGGHQQASGGKEGYR